MCVCVCVECVGGCVECVGCVQCVGCVLGVWDVYNMCVEGVQCVVCVHVQGMYVGCVCMWGIWECVGRRGWEEGRKKIS